MSCVVCESYAVQLRPVADALVVLYSVRLALVVHSQSNASRHNKIIDFQSQSNSI